MQGLGGAVVDAVSLSLIVDLFTETGDRAKAMGVYGFVCSGGGSIGALLGGLLVNSFDWHWIFLVNIPIGIAVIALSLSLVPAAKQAGADRHLDVGGAITVTAALMLAIYAIVNGNEAGWASTQTLGLLAGSVVLLIVFVVIEAHVKHAADAARHVAPAQSRDGERRRHAVGGGDVRVVLPVRAVSATRARLHADAGRRWPSCRPT